MFWSVNSGQVSQRRQQAKCYFSAPTAGGREARNARLFQARSTEEQQSKEVVSSKPARGGGSCPRKRRNSSLQDAADAEHLHEFKKHLGLLMEETSTAGCWGRRSQCRLRKSPGHKLPETGGVTWEALAHLPWSVLFARRICNQVISVGGRFVPLHYGWSSSIPSGLPVLLISRQSYCICCSSSKTWGRRRMLLKEIFGVLSSCQPRLSRRCKSREPERAVEPGFTFLCRDRPLPAKVSHPRALLEKAQLHRPAGVLGAMPVKPSADRRI